MNSLEKVVKSFSPCIVDLSSLFNLSSILGDLSLESLLFKLIKTKNDKVSLSGFKNGNTFKELNIISDLKEDTILGDLRKLPCSLRITNTQLVDKNLKHLCASIYKTLGLPVTVNMYITPGEDRSCFQYHPDPQESFIYQLVGSKMWSFPIDENKDYIYCEKQDFSKEKTQDFIVKEVLLSQNEVMYLPHCVLHKAQANADQLSVHLTFAALNFTKASFKVFLKDRGEALDLSNDFYAKATEENVIHWLSLLEDEYTYDDSLELYHRFKNITQIEAIKILKKGRPYFQDSQSD